MDFLSYFRTLRRRWYLVLVCALLGAGMGYSLTLFEDDESTEGRTYHTATTTLLLNTGPDDNPLPAAVTNPDQMAFLVTGGVVPDLVAEKLGSSDTGRDLSEHIITTTDAITSTLDITAAAPDATDAEQLADTFAAELQSFLNQRNQEFYDTAVADLDQKATALDRQADDLFNQLSAFPPPANVETIRTQYEATTNRYHEVYGQLQDVRTAGPPTTLLTVFETAQAQPIDAAEYRARLELGALGQNTLRTGFDEEEAPTLTTPSSPFDSPASRTIVGGFLGLLIGVGLALLLDRLDRRVRSREEVEEAFGLPVLADVPRLSRGDLADDALVSFTAPLSRVAEAYRAVRTSLAFQQSVTAGMGHAGGNGTNGSTNGSGDPHADSVLHDPLVVLVSSAAPREGKSTTTANLAVAFAEADASVLVINCDFRRPAVHKRFGVPDEPRRVQETRVPGVKIVTNVLHDPRANPAHVVAAQRHVIAAARGRFDVVLLDTAPLLTANDALDVVGVADLVVLVAQSGMTTRDNAQRVTELLRRVDAPMAGVVLLATSDSANSDYYYYYQRGQAAKQRADVDATGVATVPEVDLFTGAPDDVTHTDG